MAMSIGPAEDGDDEVVAAINTTPLVDIMLVLLIIFLITIPVVTHSVPVSLPKEVNIPTQTKPDNINLSVAKDGAMFWNEQPVADIATLFDKMKAVAIRQPQPEVHIRGDQDARYAFIGKIIVTCQRAGISKVGFITEPPPHGG